MSIGSNACRDFSEMVRLFTVTFPFTFFLVGFTENCRVPDVSATTVDIVGRHREFLRDCVLGVLGIRRDVFGFTGYVESGFGFSAGFGVGISGGFGLVGIRASFAF